MQRGKTTKITVYDDSPTSISSSMYGANLDCYAFNVGFIAKKSPQLALKLIELYEQCKKLKEK